MTTRSRIAAFSLGLGLVLATTYVAVQVPATTTQPKAPAAGDYETNPETLRAIATGGSPMGRWKEGLTFDGVAPMPWLKSAANWFPKTEDVQPDEIRVTFMGSSPMPRPGQHGHLGLRRAREREQLHLRHGTWLNRQLPGGGGTAQSPERHLHYPPALGPLRLRGVYLHVRRVGRPLAREVPGHGAVGHEARVRHPLHGGPDEGDAVLASGELRESPIGKGFDLDVHEFDFRDDGGVAYEKNGVKITHWRQSHTEDGASAYRLDWNGMCVAFTGDGRPNSLTIKYAEGLRPRDHRGPARTGRDRRDGEWRACQ